MRTDLTDPRQSISRAALRYHLALLLTLVLGTSLDGFAKSQNEAKKSDKKKPEPFKVQKLTQGMGLYSIAGISPDGQSILLLARKPGESPNLYVMKIGDHSIAAPLTQFKLGIAEPRWSGDGSSVAFSASSESASFPDIYTLELRTGKLRQLTTNSFSDTEPVYTPDGKRLLFTSDESPLPDAAFGTLHIASVSVGGGKAEIFAEDDDSAIHPGVSSDGKSALLVKINEHSGRHSLWLYGLDGKAQRDLTERKFARIHRYINAVGGLMVLWAQEEPEQQDGVYILDPKSGEVRELPDPDLPKRNPTVSADGKLIAFISPTETGSQVFVCDPTLGEIKQVTFKPGNAHSPMFVSNSEILFGSDREKDNEIFSVDVTQPITEEKKKK